jgi:hypothetical protein
MSFSVRPANSSDADIESILRLIKELVRLPSLARFSLSLPALLLTIERMNLEYRPFMRNLPRAQRPRPSCSSRIFSLKTANPMRLA